VEYVVGLTSTSTSNYDVTNIEGVPHWPRNEAPGSPQLPHSDPAFDIESECGKYGPRELPDVGNLAFQLEVEMSGVAAFRLVLIKHERRDLKPKPCTNRGWMMLIFVGRRSWPQGVHFSPKPASQEPHKDPTRTNQLKMLDVKSKISPRGWIPWV
jgi:hypothetical protein